MGEWPIELLLNLLAGIGLAVAILLALFLFGCVMCALTDDGPPYRTPLLARAIGWATIAGPVLIVLGWMVRSAA